MFLKTSSFWSMYSSILKRKNRRFFLGISKIWQRIWSYLVPYVQKIEHWFLRSIKFLSTVPYKGVPYENDTECIQGVL